MKVIRQWKSDGSTNVMEMWAATENLVKNLNLRSGDLLDLERRLMHGESFETRWAVFFADPELS